MARACPSCSAPLEDDAQFCASCGRRVEPPASVEPPCAPRVESPCAPRVEPPCVPCAEPLGAQEVRMPSGSSPFELSAALPMALQVGRRSLVYVRFRAATDLYESVEFVLRNGNEELCRRPCGFGRPGTQERKVALEVLPKCSGTACVELDVVCRVDAEAAEVHTAELQLVVEEKSATAFSPVFNISQQQTSDRAGRTEGGDVNVNLGGLQLRQEEDPSRYETNPSAFAALGARLQKSPARLTLNAGDEVVQLVSDRVVTFGRNRDNTVALRVCGADGRVDRLANESNISRFHFRIECEGRECRLRDGYVVEDTVRGGVERQGSAYGTRIGGESLAQAGCVCLLPGRDLTLAIGREEVELRMRLRLFCDAWQIPQGFLLDRQDGARQRICGVWREIPLDGERGVAWNGSAWSLTSPSGCVPLAVGTTVTIGGKKFAVLPYYQTHVN